MEDNEIIEGLKSGRAYDFVANNYWKMDKEQLKDIILELLALLDDKVCEKNYIKELTENLIIYKSWEK